MTVGIVALGPRQGAIPGDHAFSFVLLTIENGHNSKQEETRRGTCKCEGIIKQEAPVSAGRMKDGGWRGGAASRPTGLRSVSDVSVAFSVQGPDQGGSPLQQAGSSTGANASSPLTGGPQTEGSWSQRPRLTSFSAVPVGRASRGSS